MRDAVHPSNEVLLDGAASDGLYESAAKRRSAAEWLNCYAHERHASIAIRGARDGVEDADFKAVDGAVWHLRRVELIED